MQLQLKRVDRPRELKWYQAGGLLYGDWGTSKAYVLGIAFALSGSSSWFFLGLMSILTAVVGLCYIVICRVSPDGGGVYSSVRTRSRTVAVIGSFLLMADYVITASLSALDAFHYFQIPNPEIWAIIAILVIGLANWIGPSRGSYIAMLVAVAASAVVFIIFICMMPALPHAQLAMPDFSKGFHNWTVFVGIVLALSGVEAVANMTGIMVEPVGKTSKWAILPVLLEVSILLFLLGIGMNAIPGLYGHTEDMLHALGTHYVGNWFGPIVSIVFGFLLLSAANTAISSFVSIQYLMAKDRELPPVFASLNRFGMPWLALIIATLVPATVLVIEHHLVKLAALYAIGVVGAITLNLAATATNFKVKLSKFERTFLFATAFVLFFVEITIGFEKPYATIFAASFIVVGLTLRTITKAVTPEVPDLAIANIEVLSLSEAKEITTLYHGSTMVAIRNLNNHLLKEAAIRVKAIGENAIYINYVEEAPVAPEMKEATPSNHSLKLLSEAAHAVESLGINAIPVWQLGVDPGQLLSMAAVELKINTVFIGTSRKSGMMRLLRGDVLRTLARRLPHDCHLTIIS